MTLKDDIDAVRTRIIAETTANNDVVVIAHSYGGGVGQSAIKGLTRSKVHDASSKTDGYVQGLILLSSGFGQTGVSFIDGLGGVPPPTWRLDTSGFATLTNVIPSKELFYHDLPQEEGEYWVGKLTKQSQKALVEGGESAYAGWMDLPVWLLMSTEDKAFPVEAQRYFVQVAKDAGADVTVKEIQGSHSAMLSKPKEVAGFVIEAVTAFKG
jgi:pimeloyl-ACP methyl ester carboxylesterase